MCRLVGEWWRVPWAHADLCDLAVWVRVIWRRSSSARDGRPGVKLEAM